MNFRQSLDIINTQQLDDILFSAKVSQFWFGKISSDLNRIYKISKSYITSAHLTNFWPLEIPHSGTEDTIQTIVKIVRLPYEVHSIDTRGL